MSFSIGQGDERRTVISSNNMTLNEKQFESAVKSSKSKLKRPDRPLYIPRRSRENGCLPVDQFEAPVETKTLSKECVSNIKNDETHMEDVPKVVASEKPKKKTPKNVKLDKKALKDKRPCIDDDCMKVAKNETTIEELKELKNGLEPLKSVLEVSDPLVTESEQSLSITSQIATCEQPEPSSSITESSPDVSDDNDSWFIKFDDVGNALDDKLYDELTERVGEVKIKKSTINYFEFTPKEIDMSQEEYGHLLEIYDFPKEFVSGDLNIAFKDYQNKGFEIKWVDDTHAIGIFDGVIAATSALKSFANPMLKVRPISQASRQTKLKAKSCAEYLQPYKARPQITAHVARNLLSAALGVRVNVSKEKRDEERRKINEAREKKKADIKSRKDAWEGTFEIPDDI